MRVFAIVDWWTQNLLEQLHDYLFSYLRKIPQDGTFNQGAAVTSLQKIVRDGHTTVFSLDLSAATDRLPIRIQIPLVNYLFPGLGEPWGHLLVGRAYTLTVRQDKRVIRKENLFYTVGQPMGALSSWAMLAFTHHFLVQYSANRVGHEGWFPLYAILGDDIVIADRRVALSYLKVMDTLGVGISMYKSLISGNGSFEFAKRFVYRGEDATAVSLAEMAVASTSLAALVMLLDRIGQFRSPTLGDVLAFLGRGYRVRGGLMRKYSEMSNHVRLLLVFLTQPGSRFATSEGWLPWLASSGLNRPESGSVSGVLRALQGLVARAIDSRWKRSPAPLYRREADTIATLGHHGSGPNPVIASTLMQLLGLVDKKQAKAYDDARTRFKALEAFFKFLPDEATLPKGYPKWMVDEAMDRLVEAERYGSAVARSGSLLIRKEETKIIPVGRWLHRFMMLRGAAHRGAPPSTAS